ncbi:MAG: energy transducer TonB, partial [Psychrobacter sp.]|nr:energy transducer TonB [Psychrobacter sp.]
LKAGAHSKQKAAQNNVQTVLSVNSASANGETGSNGEAEQAQTAAQSLRQSNQQSQPLPFEREIIESQAFQATLLTTDSPDTPHNTNSNSNSNTESAIKLPSNKGQANNDKALDPGSSNRRQASSHQDNNGVSGSDSNTANRTNNTTKKNVSNIPASDGSKGNDSAISSGPVDFGEREAQWITKPNIDKELSKAIVATKTQGDVIVRLRIVVNIEGQPLTVSIISGLRNPRLANQLEQKIRKARLHPFRLGEQAVAGIVTVPMRFER